MRKIVANRMSVTMAWGLMALLLVGVLLVAGSSQAQEQPTPMPVTQLPPGIPAAPQAQAPAGKKLGGSLPDLPSTPLDESKLTPEQRERFERFKKDSLPAGASFEDFVEFWMTPRPYPKSTIVRLDEHHAYPHPAVPWKMEIVKEDKDTVWLRSLPPENPESPIHREWLMHENAEAAWKLKHSREEKPYFLDYYSESVPPPSVDLFTFEEHDSKLPAKGRWQMNFVTADMNGDGNLDIVAPPPRKGGINHPVVFLGDGAGNFSYWEQTRWSKNVAYDYGSVAVADFNGDGHQDIALAVHFKDAWVLYGDGAGGFERARQLPKPDPRRTTRALAAGDLDGDGDVDLVFVAEIGYGLSDKTPLDAPTVWTVCNQGKGEKWEVRSAGLPKHPIADNISLADMNGDGRPDIVLASNLNAWRPLVYVNRDTSWEMADFAGVLASAYHFDVAAARIAGGATPDIVAAFEQFKMIDGVNQARTGLIWYTPSPTGGLNAPGKVIVMDDQKTDPYFRVATGDLNGDGRADVVTGRKGGGIEVYLQQGSGHFVRERSPEIQTGGRPFDLHILDLNGDGLGDIVGSFAPHGSAPGGLRVWLTRKGA